MAGAAIPAYLPRGNCDITEQFTSALLRTSVIGQESDCLESNLLVPCKVVNGMAGRRMFQPEEELKDISNLINVFPVDEDMVLSWLEKRFKNGNFYTNLGATVVAVNPFSDVNCLYCMEQIWAYHGNATSLPPHIYHIAETAYRRLVTGCDRRSQSIVISGESGAGKTISANLILHYLTTVCSSSPDQLCVVIHLTRQCEEWVCYYLQWNAHSEYAGTWLEQRILNSNPILEAFGNAATPRNSNSSRFGKFVELHIMRYSYTPATNVALASLGLVHHYETVQNGAISGGDIRTFLLEKTRVVHLGKGDNNFHIFYQLLGLKNLDLDCFPMWVKDMQCVISDNVFSFVPTNQDCRCNGDLRNTLAAMSSVGLPAECQAQILELVTAILHMGNIVFCEDVDGRSQLDCSSGGLLDIYGFEAFEANSLEQLCINYVNERVQRHYMVHFLEELQAECQSEGLVWRAVDCDRRQSCLDILDGPCSVFAILDEEVYLNRKLDDTVLLQRILALCLPSLGALQPVRLSANQGPGFVIQHYAGPVVYSVCDLIAKNKDDVPKDLMSMLIASKNPFVLQLFHGCSAQELLDNRRRKTVITNFKKSLDDLLSSIQCTDVHYVRCVKPNRAAASGFFDSPYVLRQLEACGAMETINICRQSFYTRMGYQEFLQRYSLILRCRHWGGYPPPDGGSPAYTDKHIRHLPGDICARILAAVTRQGSAKLSRPQFGRTKLFLSQTQVEQLETTRHQVMSLLATTVQRSWRGYRFRQLLRIALAAKVCQNFWRSYICRRVFIRRLASQKIYSALLTFHCRRLFLSTRKATIVLQRGARRWMDAKRRRCVHRPMVNIGGDYVCSLDTSFHIFQSCPAFNINTECCCSPYLQSNVGSSITTPCHSTSLMSCLVSSISTPCHSPSLMSCLVSSISTPCHSPSLMSCPMSSISTPCHSPSHMSSPVSSISTPCHSSSIMSSPMSSVSTPCHSSSLMSCPVSSTSCHSPSLMSCLVSCISTPCHSPSLMSCPMSSISTSCHSPSHMSSPVSSISTPCHSSSIMSCPMSSISTPCHSPSLMSSPVSSTSTPCCNPSNQCSSLSSIITPCDDISLHSSPSFSVSSPCHKIWPIQDNVHPMDREVSLLTEQSSKPISKDRNISHNTSVKDNEPSVPHHPRKTLCADMTGGLLTCPSKKQLMMSVKMYPRLYFVNVGSGVFSRRNIPATAVYFHVRPSVLKFGHCINCRSMPQGLLDLLSELEPTDPSTEYDLSVDHSDRSG